MYGPFRREKIKGIITRLEIIIGRIISTYLKTVDGGEIGRRLCQIRIRRCRGPFQRMKSGDGEDGGRLPVPN